MGTDVSDGCIEIWRFRSARLLVLFLMRPAIFKNVNNARIKIVERYNCIVTDDLKTN